MPCIFFRANPEGRAARVTRLAMGAADPVVLPTLLQRGGGGPRLFGLTFVGVEPGAVVAGGAGDGRLAGRASLTVGGVVWETHRDRWPHSLTSSARPLPRWRFSRRR